jgi:hypothetical protein
MMGRRGAVAPGIKAVPEDMEAWIKGRAKVIGSRT